MEKDIIDLSDIGDEFVIHYGGQLHSVEANTFANSLVSLAKIIEEINYQQHPDFNIEVRIEALTQGSFRPKIKIFGKTLKSKIIPYLPEKKSTIPVLITLLALFQNSHKDAHNKDIVVNDNFVTIYNNDNRIILDKKIYDNAKELSKNKNMTSLIERHFETIDSDSSIDSFGIVKKVDDKNYLFYAKKSEFKNFINQNKEKEDDGVKEEIIQNQRLSLLKVILERGSRKWEFVWNGIRISAPVIDDDFWEAMKERKVKITQGDSIIADLKIYKALDPYSGIYLNERYEVIKVEGYAGGLKQEEIQFTT